MIKVILISSLCFLILKVRNFRSEIIPEFFNPCNFGFVSNGSTCEECGLIGNKRNVRIVGGTDANMFSWPSHVLVKQSVKIDFNEKNFDRTVTETFECGGTLLNHYTILTAAHCINMHIEIKIDGGNKTVPITPNEYYPTFESMFTVLIGMYRVNNKYEKSIERHVSKVIIHPNWDHETFIHDIALLILEHPVKYQKHVKPACLPRSEEFDFPKQNLDCYVAGWGLTEEDGNSSVILQNVKLKTHETSLCSYVVDQNKLLNESTQICAGSLEGGQGTCQKDSGGGLYIVDVTTGKQRNVVAGIISYGSGCGLENHPSIFTRVSFYLDWIYSNWVIDGVSNIPCVIFTVLNAATKLNNFHNILCIVVVYIILLFINLYHKSVIGWF